MTARSEMRAIERAPATRQATAAPAPTPSRIAPHRRPPIDRRTRLDIVAACVLAAAMLALLLALGALR